VAVAAAAKMRPAATTAKSPLTAKEIVYSFSSVFPARLIRITFFHDTKQ
jgi:hypothetical protein